MQVRQSASMPKPRAAAVSKIEQGTPREQPGEFPHASYAGRATMPSMPRNKPRSGKKGLTCLVEVLQKEPEVSLMADGGPME